jgi:hypothetical protein
MPNSIVELYLEFKDSRDTLRIYNDGQCIFSSVKDFLTPLVEYITVAGPVTGPVVILDKVIGNAAALLAVKIGAKRVLSPLGSELAACTLQANNVEYYFENEVPFILARNGVDMCPMEKLSQDKTPEEFYTLIKSRSGILVQGSSGETC